MGKNGRLKTGEDIVDELRRRDNGGVLRIEEDGDGFRILGPQKGNSRPPLIKIPFGKVSNGDRKLQVYLRTFGFMQKDESEEQGPKPPGILPFALSYLRTGKYSPSRPLNVDDLMALYTSEYPPKLTEGHPPTTNKSPHNMGLLLAEHTNIGYTQTGVYWVAT